MSYGNGFCDLYIYNFFFQNNIATMSFANITFIHLQFFFNFAMKIPIHLILVPERLYSTVSRFSAFLNRQEVNEYLPTQQSFY